MNNILTTLGIDASAQPGTTPNLAGHYLLFHFLLAYVATSTRVAKISLKIDHNVNPREDIDKYGDRAVKDGKMTAAQLRRLKRTQACHENSMEHYPAFVGAMLWATQAGLSNTAINTAGLVYSVARISYAISYIFTEDHRLSYIRSLCWWASNIVCLNLFWKGGKAINSGI